MRKFLRKLFVREAKPAATPEYRAEVYEMLARLGAAQEFVNTWAEYGTAVGLGLVCREAETLAELFSAFGDDASAGLVLSSHAPDDGCGDMHHACDECTPTSPFILTESYGVQA
ncbi:hypothetical protein [Streptomyces sp. NPDC048489]|uniref:hypothetical protein n=1 Tax=Streptomyces sp. NPDC048489 TaxID=3154504 RepID=UPI00342966EB